MHLTPREPFLTAPLSLGHQSPCIIFTAEMGVLTLAPGRVLFTLFWHISKLPLLHRLPSVNPESPFFSTWPNFKNTRENIVYSSLVNPFIPYDLPSPWPPRPQYYNSLLQGWRNLLQRIACSPLFFWHPQYSIGLQQKVPPWMGNRPFKFHLEEGFQGHILDQVRQNVFALFVNFKRYLYIHHYSVEAFRRD